MEHVTSHWSYVYKHKATVKEIHQPSPFSVCCWSLGERQRYKRLRVDSGVWGNSIPTLIFPLPLKTLLSDSEAAASVRSVMTKWGSPNIPACNRDMKIPMWCVSLSGYPRLAYCGWHKEIPQRQVKVVMYQCEVLVPPSLLSRALAQHCLKSLSKMCASPPALQMSVWFGMVVWWWLNCLGPLPLCFVFAFSVLTETYFFCNSVCRTMVYNTPNEALPTWRLPPRVHWPPYSVPGAPYRNALWNAETIVIDVHRSFFSHSTYCPR